MIKDLTVHMTGITVLMDVSVFRDGEFCTSVMFSEDLVRVYVDDSGFTFTSTVDVPCNGYHIVGDYMFNILGGVPLAEIVPLVDSHQVSIEYKEAVLVEMSLETANSLVIKTTDENHCKPRLIDEFEVLDEDRYVATSEGGKLLKGEYTLRMSSVGLEVDRDVLDKVLSILAPNKQQPSAKASIDEHTITLLCGHASKKISQLRSVLASDRPIMPDELNRIIEAAIYELAPQLADKYKKSILEMPQVTINKVIERLVSTGKYPLIVPWPTGPNIQMMAPQL